MNDGPEIDRAALDEQPEGGPLSPGDTGRTGLVAGEDTSADRRRATSRADGAPPEEQEGEPDDPLAQAGAILAESDERQEDRSAAPGSSVEHRTSDEATPPPT